MRASKHLYLTAGLAAVTGIAGLALADLLGIAGLLNFPVVAYDATGVTDYNAGTDLFMIDGAPLSIRFSASLPPVAVFPFDSQKVLTIDVLVDQNGMLFGGVPEADLILVGTVLTPSGDTFSGTLLTGEGAEFGFLDSGGTTDEYDFRFTVTGGLLADAFFTNPAQDIGVTVTSESSNFGGVFNVNFGGEAKGNLGPLDLQDGQEGCTPGYWKQPHHEDSWPGAYDPMDLFEDVFDRNVLGDASPMLSEALRLKKGGLNALIRHATAALLNAATPGVDPDPAFDTTAEVIAAFQAAFDSGPTQVEILKDLLDDSNNLGCPLN